MLAAAFLSAPLPGSAQDPSNRILAGPTVSERIEDGAIGSLPVDSLPGPPRAFVLSLLAPECPLSRNHVFTLNALRETFREDGVAFIGIFPRIDAGAEADAMELEEFRAGTGADFAFVGDIDLEWTRRLGGTVTPEVFLLDDEGRVLYSGAVDNWAVSLGRKRRAATEHHLRDALAAWTNDAAPPRARVEPVGCLIE